MLVLFTLFCIQNNVFILVVVITVFQLLALWPSSGREFQILFNLWGLDYSALYV